MNRPGEINDQLNKEITASSFGICVVSEPSQGGGHQDNQNVLIEAGMMHGLQVSGINMVGWFLVREKAPPELPFDFAHQRAITIPRLANDAAKSRRSFGRLAQDAIGTDIRFRLEATMAGRKCGRRVSRHRGEQFEIGYNKSRWQDRSMRFQRMRLPMLRISGRVIT